MLKSIMIGLDGTECSLPALELGQQWAKQSGARLVGIAIVDEPGIHVADALAYSEGYHRVITSVLPEARQKAAEVLEQFTTSCNRAGVACQTREAGGTPFVQILLEAQRYDLIVLGRETHFEFGWRDQSDETLTRILGESPRPVVSVPKKPVAGKAVVVANDGSLQAARALYAFEASGLGLDRLIHVVCVHEDEDEAIQIATRAIDFLRSHNLDAVSHPLESKRSTAEILLDELRRLDAGLLVMGAYGQPALREFFLGSVTRTLLRQSAVPLFCFH
jgi:nucleotide-binding universal stress UspA family protein